MAKIFCPSSCLDQVRGHVLSCYPAEACGLLIGNWDASHSVWRILRCEEVRNLSDRADRFELDSSVRLKMQRELREEGANEKIIGHYHSHPNAPATPSVCDQSRAEECGLIWMILSITENEQGQIFCDDVACFEATNQGLQKRTVEFLS